MINRQFLYIITVKSIVIWINLEVLLWAGWNSGNARGPLSACCWPFCSSSPPALSGGQSFERDAKGILGYRRKNLVLSSDVLHRWGRDRDLDVVSVYPRSFPGFSHDLVGAKRSLETKEKPPEPAFSGGFLRTLLRWENILSKVRGAELNFTCYFSRDGL